MPASIPSILRPLLGVSRPQNAILADPNRPMPALGSPAMLARRHRLAAVEAAFRSLPGRYLGAEPGFDATFHIRLGDVGHTWEVRATTHGARVRKGVTRR